MELEDITQLNNGDEVYWNDPDNGACSRYITIQNIQIKGDIIQISSHNDYLECFAYELS